MSSAGLFTPCGKASYPSVTYQLAVPASSPACRNWRSSCRRFPAAAARSILPCSSCAASSASRDVFRVNGPAGIAALGFGTESIPKVRKVVGPGSPAVTIAQVEMQRHGVRR